MGDFYVDDQFFDHPKALAAGEDAANLYVRGLAWAHRHNTGLLPQAALDRLTTKRNVRASAARLVTERLWHVEGDGYRIHDWTTRNAKSISKREQSKAAANERWRRYSENHETGNTNPSQRNHNGITMPPGTMTAFPASTPNEPAHAQTAKPQVNDPPPYAFALHPHMHPQCDRNADAMPYQPRNQGTKEPVQLSSSSHLHLLQTGWEEEDEIA